MFTYIIRELTHNAEEVIQSAARKDKETKYFKNRLKKIEDKLSNSMII